MADLQHLAVDLGIILLLIVGISQFRAPRGARRGNLIEALALILAAATVVYRYPPVDLWLVIPVLLVGGFLGWIVAARVNMVQIPAMVAFQHGMGGIAATFVSLVELTRHAEAGTPPVNAAAGLLGLIIGAATFSGSMIASGKLAGRLKQTPIVLPRHDVVLLVLVVLVAVLAIVSGAVDSRLDYRPLIVLTLVSVVLGVVFSMRIGGADMPVLISFLNATAGLAAAFCGLTIENRLLIACGATVAASGSILTHVMCRAMNRSLLNVCVGIAGKTAPPAPAPEVAPVSAADPEPSAAGSPTTPACDSKADPLASAVEAARNAGSVIIIPGYGMALAQAQFEVVQLARKLEEMGKQVRFAVHPVAGRMPGHMHVLLAEADVDYEKLYELDRINQDFRDTDLVLIVGACDVVNPAAIDVPGTPISGMPILLACEARQIVVCNLDERPGYSGVENPLYRSPKTILLLGDAKGNVAALLQGLA